METVGTPPMEKGLGVTGWGAGTTRPVETTPRFSSTWKTVPLAERNLKTEGGCQALSIEEEMGSVSDRETRLRGQLHIETLGRRVSAAV